MKMSASAIPARPVPAHDIGISEMDVDGTDEDTEDLYTKLKTLQRELEFLEIQVPLPPFMLLLASDQSLSSRISFLSRILKMTLIGARIA